MGWGTPEAFNQNHKNLTAPLPPSHDEEPWCSLKEKTLENMRTVADNPVFFPECQDAGCNVMGMWGARQGPALSLTWLSPPGTCCERKSASEPAGWLWVLLGSAWLTLSPGCSARAGFNVFNTHQHLRQQACKIHAAILTTSRATHVKEPAQGTCTLDMFSISTDTDNYIDNPKDRADC